MEADAPAAPDNDRSVHVPEGWRSCRLGELFCHIVDRGHSDDLPLLAVTMSDGVRRRDGLDRRVGRAAPREDSLRVRPEDIVYNTMRMWQGASGLAREEGYVSPAYTVVRAREGESPAFWSRYFKHPAVVKLFLDHSHGVAKDKYRLYYHHFAEVPVLRPPHEEQTRIAAVLDAGERAIARGRAALDQTNSILRALLQEHIATPNEVHSECPPAWRRVRLTEIARLESGHTPSRRIPAYWEGGDIPWLSLRDMEKVRTQRRLTETNEKITQAGIDNSSARLLPAGTVVFSRTAVIGAASVLERPMATTQDFANWICGPEIRPDFLMYTLRALQSNRPALRG